MSWARVLNDRQIQALSCLYQSAAPSARETGIRLATIRQLERLGIVERTASTGGDLNKHTRVRVTPAGFRAWADILESRRRLP